MKNDKETPTIEKILAEFDEDFTEEVEVPSETSAVRHEKGYMWKFNKSGSAVSSIPQPYEVKQFIKQKLLEVLEELKVEKLHKEFVKDWKKRFKHTGPWRNHLSRSGKILLEDGYNQAVEELSQKIDEIRGENNET